VFKIKPFIINKTILLVVRLFKLKTEFYKFSIFVYEISKKKPNVVIVLKRVHFDLYILGSEGNVEKFNYK